MMGERIIDIILTALIGFVIVVLVLFMVGGLLTGEFKSRPENEYCKSVFSHYITINKVQIPQYRRDCITPAPSVPR